METQWYVVVDELGAERSVGTVLAEELPPGWDAIPISAPPNYSLVEWDGSLRVYVARSDVQW